MGPAPAVAARVEELCSLHGLPPAAQGRLHTLLEVLRDPLAPTTVHDPEASVEVHLADALSGLAAVLAAGSPVRLADLGAGAGVPGLVLAIALADCEVVLVESVRRKAEFIAGAVAALGLSNARATWARAEELHAEREAFDVVTARALAPLNVLCEYAAPLLRLGGRLVCWKGDVDDRERADGLAAAQAFGLEPIAADAVAPYPGSRRRTLWSFEKRSATPPQYPRRPGMALKRPISATTL